MPTGEHAGPEGHLIVLMEVIVLIIFVGSDCSRPSAYLVPRVFLGKDYLPCGRR
jgi:hypothetical protein